MIAVGLAACLCAGCSNPPSEDEIIVRAEDFEGRCDTLSQRQAIVDSTASGDTAALADDTLSLLEDAHAAQADSLPADSAALGDGPDSLPADTASVPAGWRSLAMEARGSLYATIQAGLEADSQPSGPGPDVLGAHCSRCMWWDMRPWEDLIAGDSLYVVWTDSVGEGLENRVVALRYVPVEGSANGEFSVYRYLRTGDNYPSYWYPDGTEAPAMLDAMPVSTFEEITGIFGEPRSGHTHEGVDFKAPVGTPVVTRMGGTVTRTDWNTAYNGHCVEVDIGGGYSQVFIHLDGLAEGIRPGAQVEAGGLVGYVGNTGRSYAPHLHYQINDRNSGYAVDPYIFHGCHRRSLPEGDMDGFRDMRDLCDSLMLGSR
jgi:outer membrane murein-binding lipoprotein Lpp